MFDLTFVNHGSIVIMTPTTDVGRAWVDEHIPEDALTWGKDGIVIEHRYVGDIVEGALRDGLDINLGRA